jgi:hypothetical protein
MDDWFDELGVVGKNDQSSNVEQHQLTSLHALIRTYAQSGDIENTVRYASQALSTSGDSKLVQRIIERLKYDRMKSVGWCVDNDHAIRVNQALFNYILKTYSQTELHWLPFIHERLIVYYTTPERNGQVNIEALRMIYQQLIQRMVIDESIDLTRAAIASVTREQGFLKTIEIDKFSPRSLSYQYILSYLFGIKDVRLFKKYIKTTNIYLLWLLYALSDELESFTNVQYSWLDKYWTSLVSAYDCLDLYQFDHICVNNLQKLNYRPLGFKHISMNLIIEKLREKLAQKIVNSESPLYAKISYYENEILVSDQFSGRRVSSTTQNPVIVEFSNSYLKWNTDTNDVARLQFYSSVALFDAHRDRFIYIHETRLHVGNQILIQDVYGGNQFMIYLDNDQVLVLDSYQSSSALYYLNLLSDSISNKYSVSCGIELVVYRRKSHSLVAVRETTISEISLHDHSIQWTMNLYVPMHKEKRTDLYYIESLDQIIYAYHDNVSQWHIHLIDLQSTGDQHWELPIIGGHAYLVSSFIPVVTKDSTIEFLLTAQEYIYEDEPCMIGSVVQCKMKLYNDVHNLKRYAMKNRSLMVQVNQSRLNGSFCDLVFDFND